MDKDKLKELLKRAVEVARWRTGDVSTEDGTFATTELDQMIHLEIAVQDYFGLEAHEIEPIYRIIDEL